MRKVVVVTIAVDSVVVETKTTIRKGQENEIEIGEETTETVVELESTIQKKEENETETGGEIAEIVTEIKKTIRKEGIVKGIGGEIAEVPVEMLKTTDLTNAAMIEGGVDRTTMIIEAMMIDTRMMPAMAEHAMTIGILIKTNPIGNPRVSSSEESEAEKIDTMRNSFCRIFSFEHYKVNI